LKLLELIRKEMRELLREPSILLGVVLAPLIILPLLGVAISTAGQDIAGQAEPAQILLIDLDRGPYSEPFKKALTSAGLNPIYEASDHEDVFHLMEKHNLRAALVLGRDFSQNLLQRTTARVNLYASLPSLSTAELQRLSTLQSRLRSAVETMGESLASELGLQIAYYKAPVSVSETRLLFRNSIVSSEELGGLIQLYLTISFAVPILLLILLSTSGTVAATSVGLEKEAKTLEILLTMPISRITILLSKLLGSLIIAVLGAISMVIGLSIYLPSVIPTTGGASIVSITISPLSLAFLAVILFISMLAGFSIGILAGVLAGDVRGGQQLASLIQMPLLLLPFLVLFISDLDTLPQHVSTALLLNPFTHMLLAVRAVILEDYYASSFHIGFLALFVLLMLLLAAWLFQGERLLTMRIRLGRRRSTG
jgi:ABC-2 type transport system permease protein